MLPKRTLQHARRQTQEPESLEAGARIAGDNGETRVGQSAPHPRCRLSGLALFVLGM